MLDDGDEKVIGLTRPAASITAAILGDPAAYRRPASETEPDGLPPLDNLAPLPLPGDPYKAHSRPAHQGLPTLLLILADGRKLGYPYTSRIEGPHLLPDGAPGRGDALVLRFSAGIAVEVTLLGRHLGELHNYLAEHRIRWVREWPTGKVARDDGAPLIARIRIEQAQGWPAGGA